MILVSNLEAFKTMDAFKCLRSMEQRKRTRGVKLVIQIGTSQGHTISFLASL